MQNFRNTIISKKEIENIIAPYRVHNLYLYQRSFALQCFYEQLFEEGNPLVAPGQVFEKSNETLETVGDSVIGSVIVEYLEERFPGEREGFISLMKMNITKTDGLSLLASKLNFSKYLLLSSETEKSDIKVNLESDSFSGRENPELLENCFEAFIGALFLDYKKVKNAGEAYSVCRQFIVSQIEKYLDFSELILRRDNYKNILQHYFHTRKWPLPTYADLGTICEGDRRVYTRGIYLDRFHLSEKEIYSLMEKYKKNNVKIINDNKILIGIGSSYKKKNADQICAKDFLSLFSPDELELQLEISN